MTNVKVVVAVGIVAEAESWPVTVIVYVPLGGLEMVVDDEPPQAESARPTAATAIIAARPRKRRA